MKVNISNLHIKLFLNKLKVIHKKRKQFQGDTSEASIVNKKENATPATIK